MYEGLLKWPMNSPEPKSPVRILHPYNLGLSAVSFCASHDVSTIPNRLVPPNCTYVQIPWRNQKSSFRFPPPSFELCDLDQGELPYPENHFDLIHARSVHAGVRRLGKKTLRRLVQLSFVRFTTILTSYTNWLAFFAQEGSSSSSNLTCILAQTVEWHLTWLAIVTRPVCRDGSLCGTLTEVASKLDKSTPTFRVG
jgi:hypothetical protein